MANPLDVLQEYLYSVGDHQQWVQSSPILPPVWRGFVSNPGKRVDVLLTPTRSTSPGMLAREIQGRLLGSEPTAKEVLDLNIAHNQTLVAATLTFAELVEHVIPLSQWYSDLVDETFKSMRALTSTRVSKKRVSQFLAEIDDPKTVSNTTDSTALWWLRIVNFVNSCEPNSTLPDSKTLRTAWDSTKHLINVDDVPESPMLFRVFLNRQAQTSSLDGVKTVKADAAKRVFDVDTSSITWAVLDSGIDALHPAFHHNEERKTPRRIIATYDFTKLRTLVALASAPGDAAENELKTQFDLTKAEATGISAALRNGQPIDWERLRPALQVKHTTAKLRAYAEDLHPHGTHVAGVLGGLAKVDDEFQFQGICPSINLIDVRVLDRDGQSKASSKRPEFSIIGALQFIAHLNSNGNELKVHGVNLSVQLKHVNGDFACGRTPVCNECNSLSSSGVVVVAAAGNFGIDNSAANATTAMGDFRDISITDPGNAEHVITVGSTHRKRPFEYGVSFFSGRGPTGDGRQKPDLIAPGEKILGPVGQNGYETMQGTSQAAPYVSGAAAMLMARNPELIGDPTRIKEILCQTATDLGREKQFQGAGLVDVLRAMQSV